MFDIAPSELLLVVIVAILVIGPKDLPLALRTAGRWLGKVRRVSGHFRSGIETMIREAELEEMERKWKEQNAAIMAQSLARNPPQHLGPDPGEGQTVDAAADQTDAPLMQALPPPLEPDPIDPDIAAHAPPDMLPISQRPARKRGAP